MADKKYFIDDRVIIPDDIKNMSTEEIELEIARLESELLSRKNKKFSIFSFPFCTSKLSFRTRPLLTRFFINGKI